ncbi:unnamed protein product [Symbiodinium natans]|uniref:G domain-containing protein n=1 Tax=Symbiodinium natans TaxID=878477 RepID=A0A812S9T7_9DINO|nr:unnamed protein product [Symbiodinium natans]
MAADPALGMAAIMESQVEEMRKLLSRFKVCTNPAGAGADVDAGTLPGHVDILIFGPSGSGKSSLIRTFYMALHKSQQVPADFADRIIVKDTAMNEGTLKYISAVIKPAKLDHRGNIISSSILCHDTRGQIWMDEREQKQLSVIMDGNVKDDSMVQQRNYRYARLLWEFWKRDSELFPPEILANKRSVHTQPHAVLFVFDGSMEEIPDGEEETRFYREIIQMCREKGYNNPQVVLTRIDRVEESITKAGNQGASSIADREMKLRQVLDKKIEDVCMKLDVPRTAVHFIENYHSGVIGLEQEVRNISVDFHALKILSQCCSHADAFIAQALRDIRAPACAIQ